jgi:ribosomal protein S27AE
LRLWKIPDQVLRLGILLALAAIALIVLRSRFVPESFGETGHYRGAAVEAIRGQSLKYAGSEVCVDCHDEVSESKSSSYHRSLSCEVCHGPVAIHSEDYIDCHDPHDPTPPEVPESCAACHAQIARTKAVSHHLTLGCETCHEVPAEHREDPRSFLPRKPTTRDFCGSCHSTEEARFRVPQIDLPTHGGRYLCWQCHYPHFPES